MPTRSTESTFNFRQPFGLSAIDGPLPAGTYHVITEEETLDGLSFVAWQRTATLLLLPAGSLPGKARVVVPVDPEELAASFAANALKGP
jgi:hypothetical protein